VRSAAEIAERETRKLQKLIIALRLRKLPDKSPEAIEKFIEKLEEEGSRVDD